MKKRIIANSDTTGRITAPKGNNSKMKLGSYVEPRKSVRHLYPLEPTTISEAKLDGAIVGAMNKRLHAAK